MVVVLLLNTVELTSRDNMPAEPKMYKIQEGDTLSDLFGQNWQEVAAFNGIEDPTKLQIGQEINVNLYEPSGKQTPAPQEMNTSASGEQGFLKGAADWATGYFEDFTAGAETFGDDVYSTFVNSPMPQTLEELGSPEELAAMEDIGAPAVPETNDLNTYAEYIAGYEGFKANPYKATEGEEFLTIGYGHYGEDVTEDTPPLNQEQAQGLLEKDIDTRLGAIRKNIPDFDNLSEDVRKNLVAAWFRGSLSGSPKAIGLINAGEFDQAADEFLDNDEYRNAEEMGRAGIIPRMDAVAESLRNYNVE